MSRKVDDMAQLIKSIQENLPPTLGARQLKAIDANELESGIPPIPATLQERED